LISRREKRLRYPPLKFYKGEIPIYCFDKITHERVLSKFHLVPTPVQPKRKVKNQKEDTKSPTKLKSPEDKEKEKKKVALEESEEEAAHETPSKRSKKR